MVKNDQLSMTTATLDQLSQVYQVLNNNNIMKDEIIVQLSELPYVLELNFDRPTNLSIVLQ